MVAREKTTEPLTLRDTLHDTHLCMYQWFVDRTRSTVFTTSASGCSSHNMQLRGDSWGSGSGRQRLPPKRGHESQDHKGGHVATGGFIRRGARRRSCKRTLDDMPTFPNGLRKRIWSQVQSTDKVVRAVPRQVPIKRCSAWMK